MLRPENNFARNLLNMRGRRAMATLLTQLEASVQPHVDAETWNNVRSSVLTVIGDFQDLAMDMISAETGVINDYWAEKLEQIHDAVRGR